MAANIRNELAPAILEMRNAGKTWTQIGKALGITGTTAHMAIDEDYAARRRAKLNALRREQTSRVTEKNHVTPPSRMTATEIKMVMARIPKDTRTPMQRLFGDPLPGRSALDMRMGARP